MSAEDSIRMLMMRGNAPGQLGPVEWKRGAARCAWVRETMAKWSAAQREMDDRCTAAAGTMSDEEFDRLFEAEQANVDAISAPIWAVVDRDQWPKHLHYKGV